MDVMRGMCVALLGAVFTTFSIAMQHGWYGLSVAPIDELPVLIGFTLGISLFLSGVMAVVYECLKEGWMRKGCLSDENAPT